MFLIPLLAENDAVAPDPDITAPTIAITGPNGTGSSSTGTNTVTLAGTAADNVAVDRVTWSNNRGGSGTATGTTSWSKTGIILQPGVNVLTATAWDAQNNFASAVHTVTYTQADVTPPSITITSPTNAASFPVQSASLDLGGTASDNVGVASVTWANATTSASGTATGLTTWAITGIVLAQGANVITVTAHDAATNTTDRVITVTYTPVIVTLPVTETYTHADSAGSLTADHVFIPYMGAGAWGIVGNAAQLENSGGAVEGGRIDLDLGLDDYCVTLTIEEFFGPGVLVVGPCARMQGDTSRTYYSAIALVVGGVYTVSIQRFMAGVQQQIGPTVSIVPHAGMTVGIWPLGPRIRLQFDGVTRVDEPDPGGIATGRFFGLQGVSNTGTRARVASMTVTAGGTESAPPGLGVTLRPPVIVRPPVTIRPVRTL